MSYIEMKYLQERNNIRMNIQGRALGGCVHMALLSSEPGLGEDNRSG